MITRVLDELCVGRYGEPLLKCPKSNAVGLETKKKNYIRDDVFARRKSLPSKLHPKRKPQSSENHSVQYFSYSYLVTLVIINIFEKKIVKEA